MKRGYVIKAQVNGRFLSNTVVEKTLNMRNEWCVATAEPARFDSVLAARQFFFGPEADSVQPVGSAIWIEGPRGGFYRMRRPA